MECGSRERKRKRKRKTTATTTLDQIPRRIALLQEDYSATRLIYININICFLFDVVVVVSWKRNFERVREKDSLFRVIKLGIAKKRENQKSGFV